MKKKLTALLLACAMAVPNGAMPVYAEAQNGSETYETETYETESVETSVSEQAEVDETEIYASESSEAESSIEPEVQELGDYALQADQERTGGNINWNYPDNIIPTDKTTAGEGCLLAGVKGTYLADAQNALDLINQYRKEACDNGYPDPRNSGRKLTSSDYTPIKWSSDLEYIARIRAAEASVLNDHTRPNGESCFSLQSPNGIGSYGEVLAWNGSDSMLTGIEQWYDEKQDWLDQNSSAVTGHYTQMIDPDNSYVGIAAFLSRDGYYYNTTSGEFTSYENNLDEETAPAIEDCTQTIEVEKEQISASIKGLTENAEIDEIKQAVFQLKYNNCDLHYLSNVTAAALNWSSDNENVIKVDQNGSVTAVGTGQATITAESDCGLKASYKITVSKETTKITEDDVTVGDCTYTGSVIKPSVTVKHDGKTLKEGTDYTYTYTEAVQAGYTIYITVEGKGDYSGTVEKTATIQAKSIEKNTDVSVEPGNYTDIESVKAAFIVKCDGVTLEQGTDYYVSSIQATYKKYITDVDAEIQGMNNYTGLIQREVKVTLETGGAAEGGNINWNYPDNIIPTDKTVAADGCLLVGVKGSYLADAKNALKLINQYRKEACDKGYPDPRDSSRKLTSSDYVPIKWSSDLEYIARIRAAEASILVSHTRPNGESCFSLSSPNGIDSYGEVLAWNGTDSMLTGIKQWYEEKQDWLDQNADAVTGHYTQMIDPDHLYVGIAAFLNNDGVYPNTTSGEFSYDVSLDEEPAPAIQNCTQTIEVLKDDVSASISGLSNKVKEGYKGKAALKLSDNNCGLQYLSGVTGGAVEWSSNNESILKVDQKGNVTAVGTGKAAITAKTDCGLKASYTVTVSKNAAKLSISDVGVKCASDGLEIAWKSSGKAKGFYVYRSIYQNGKWGSWKQIKDITSGDTLKWKDKNVDSSNLYRYTVRSYNASEKSDYTAANIVQAYFVSRPAVKLTNGSKGVIVSWSQSKNASGYYIYRKEKKSDSWKKVKTVDGKTTKWTDTDVKAGKQYYYTVVAYRSKSRSAYETNKTIWCLAQPDFTLTNTSKGVAVKVKANKSIDGYWIYRKGSNGKWQRVATVKANKAVTWTDTSVKKNKKYTYTVRAYKKNDASSYHSGKSITYKKGK